MFVKLDAMFGKNKTEICAGIFAAASNGFLLFGRDGDQETDKNIESPSDFIKQEQLMPKAKMTKMVRNAAKCISG
jgi:hypothetical protein